MSSRKMVFRPVRIKLDVSYVSWLLVCSNIKYSLGMNYGYRLTIKLPSDPEEKTPS
jgi:hypothetical protein